MADLNLQRGCCTVVQACASGSADTGHGLLNSQIPKKFYQEFQTFVFSIGNGADLSSRGARCKVSENTGMISGVAERYASALFELASEQGVVDAVASDLSRFAEMIAESADLARVVRSPVFSAEDQLKVVSALAAAEGIYGLVANFLKLAARNRRLFILPDAIVAYSRLVSASRGEVVAQVTSALPLSDAEVADLKAALASTSGKTIRLDAKVDQSLLGGLVVKIGSRLIDTSLKTKLNSLKIALKEVR